MTQFTDDPFPPMEIPQSRPRQANAELVRSLKPLRWIGYGLLALSVINLAETLLPAKFLDPLWELTTLGSIVEQAVLPLVGFGLIFLGGPAERPRQELFGLKVLSWLSLLIGLLFFVMVPLGLLNTQRLVNLSANKLNIQAQQRAVLVQQVQKELAETESIADIEALLERFNQGQAPAINPTQPVAQIKEKLSAFIDEDESARKAQVKTTRVSQLRMLFKKSLRWNLGALVLGTLFILVWRCTGWARE